MKKILLLIIIFFALQLQADGNGTVKEFSYEYLEEPQWSDNSFYKDSYYQGTIVSRCKISALNGGGLNSLKKYYEKWFEEQSENKQWVEEKDFFVIKKDNKEVSINAKKINYTNLDKDDSGQITMNLDSYIGYDANNVLVIQSISQKVVKATDDKERLKIFKSYVRITKSKTPGYYDVYTWRFYRLQGYWYEPTNLFISGVKEKVLANYHKQMVKWFQSWAQNL